MDFEEFVQGRAPALMRYAILLTGNQHDAADLLQEALVRVRLSWHRVRRQGNPEAYVRTTMARLQISIWRRLRREVLMPTVPDRATVASDDGPVDGTDELWRSFAALPPRQRAVLVLRYVQDLSDEQIADRLGISRSTVRSNATRGLDKLRSVVTNTRTGG